MTARRIMTARLLAGLADLLQIVLFPIFGEGALSPFDTALDVTMAIVMVLLVGWHIAFLPSILIEGMPAVDLAPTWTIAVMIATRGKKRVESRVLEAALPQQAQQ